MCLYSFEGNNNNNNHTFSKPIVKLNSFISPRTESDTPAFEKLPGFRIHSSRSSQNGRSQKSSKSHVDTPTTASSILGVLKRREKAVKKSKHYQVNVDIIVVQIRNIMYGNVFRKRISLNRLKSTVKARWRIR